MTLADLLADLLPGILTDLADPEPQLKPFSPYLFSKAGGAVADPLADIARRAKPIPTAHLHHLGH